MPCIFEYILRVEPERFIDGLVPVWERGIKGDSKVFGLGSGEWSHHFTELRMTEKGQFAVEEGWGLLESFVLGLLRLKMPSSDPHGNGRQ
jgi:hypothetical protein